MKKTKKLFSMALAMSLSLSLFAGCSGGEENNIENNNDQQGSTMSGVITLITREDGSGTRGAFTEITGIYSNDEDNTTADAVAMDSTGKVITAVSGDPMGLGYISLGSLNDSVKALSVDGSYPSKESILDGSYKVSRPFNIAVSKDNALDELGQEFLEFCFTEQAQNIATDSGCIPVEVTSLDFQSATPSGELLIGGSSSVYPVMEKIVEAYKEINPNANINIESVGSSSGMSGATSGLFDIGMASREMKDSELETLQGYVLAMDGIAVIVNQENTLDNLTMEQIKEIYVGNINRYENIN